MNTVKYVMFFFKKCDWRALDALFTYHGSDVLSHRLAVLSNFPETFPPFGVQKFAAGGEVIFWRTCI